MNVASWLLWGFAATAVLAAMLAGSQGLGLTRINMPFILGTLFTANRDRAKLYGLFVHLANGWLFSLVYVAAFHVTGWFNAGFGAAIGLVHAAFVLSVALPVLPGLHPRMASELHGPTVVRVLEPPGFLGLNYGLRTPVSVLLAHAVYGALLGAFYAPH
ncbi:MAG: hypothetical protein JNK82_07835 [Myxococcaceae bacterium]|nr:hypothetical protein [Myxococcaceae bacterium]